MWGFLFKWSFLLAFLGGTYFAVARYFEHKGAAPYIAALDADKASIGKLENAIGVQNTAIHKLSDVGAAREKAGQDALGAVVARDKASRVSADRLTASSAAVRSQDAPCVISDTLAGTTGL